MPLMNGQLKSLGGKPVTPFGGLVSLIEFVNSLKLGEFMHLAYTSPNAIPPEQTLMAFMPPIIAGPGGCPTPTGCVKRFTQSVIEAFWRPLWRWLL